MRTVIKANQPWWFIDIKGIWRYRDLLWLLVKRDFTAIYKQTILGPVWFVIQPLVTSLVFTVILAKVAKMPTEGVPPFLFFMCGLIFWNYFQGCLDSVSNSLITNAGIFGKVYFPRLIPPIAVVINNLGKFFLNALVFFGLWIYMLHISKSAIQPNYWIITCPLMVLYCAVVGLGVGLWLSALTVKYKDLRFAQPFLTQLWLYATPVPYSLNLISDKYRWFYCLNPMAGVIEFARYAFLGKGDIDLVIIGSNIVIAAFLLVSGLLVYNRVQRTFIDTI